MAKIEDYRKNIEKALKTAGRYSKALDMQIISLAGAMRSLEIANAEIDDLEETTVWEETRYGKKMAPHPVFKIQRDAQDSVTRQLKALGLTVADLNGDNEADPLIELTKKVKNAGRKKATIVKPTTDSTSE